MNKSRGLLVQQSRDSLVNGHYEYTTLVRLNHSEFIKRVQKTYLGSIV